MPHHLSNVEREFYFTWSIDRVLRQLDVAVEDGLSPDEAEKRAEHFGANVLATDMGEHPLWLLVRQFTDLLILVLLGAAVLAGVIGEPVDAMAILVIVLVNGLIGFTQDYRAEQALRALQRLSAPHVAVRRSGKLVEVEERELVPGDIVRIEAGNVAPADLRIFQSVNLTVDEALLTGESLPVVKAPEAEVSQDAPIGDRANSMFKGTHVTAGHGEGVVIATGAATEIGRIADLMRSKARPRTPLQSRLAAFSGRLFVAIVFVCVVIFALGLGRGEPLAPMLLVAISLSVAAIPEALPAVVTIALALGAKRLAAHDALVRRLPAVETLGSVTVICADKTGTLTQNKMKVEKYFLADCEYETLSEFLDEDDAGKALQRAIVLNNNANISPDGSLRGDQTEVALLEAAQEPPGALDAVAGRWSRISEAPFSAERRRMTTVHAAGEEVLVITKGAPEAVLPLCSHRMRGGTLEMIDRSSIAAVAERAAHAGYRMLAFAEKHLPRKPQREEVDPDEADYVYLGLVGLADPIRPEAEDALALCAQAGISVIMVTGDHPATAEAIAGRLGLSPDGGKAITGAALIEPDNKGINVTPGSANIYARVSPEQKLTIVTALQAHGHVVAMTGDGVNDAPALKRANIGVAMGATGTDVAREAADLVLLDDNFATIVAAIKEGRRIYDNIRKFINYTMSSNIGEVWVIFLAPLLGLPLPLLPIQILWINLITDGLPGLAFGVEPSERSLMERLPRPPEESVFAHGVWQHMIWVGLLIGALCIGAQAWTYYRGSPNWQTVVFTLLVFSQLLHALALRSDRDSLFAIGVLSNKAMLATILASVAVQLSIVYYPPFQSIFHTTALQAEELLLVLTAPWLVFIAVEIEKWLVRRQLIYRPRNRGPGGRLGHGREASEEVDHNTAAAGD